LSALARLTDQAPSALTASGGILEGRVLLAGNADELLGPAPAGRSTRIMVTLPSEAADDAQLVAGFVANGMDVARVNCAHDDAEAWSRMIGSCPIEHRSGRTAVSRRDESRGADAAYRATSPGARVVRIAPRRDRMGRVVTAGRVWLTAGGDSARTDDGYPPTTGLPIEDPAWAERRRRGDRLELWDSLGARRRWEVVDVVAGGCLASTVQTTYVMTGLKLACRTAAGHDSVAIGELPQVEQFHRMHHGDRVILSRSLSPAAPTPWGNGALHRLQSAEAIQHVRPGERVWLDDGEIGRTADRVTGDEIALTVTDVGPGGAKLKAGKGINLPDTDLQLDALTPKDLEDLAFVARHADVVNVVFVPHPEDVEQLRRELDRLSAGEIGIVLKIENVAAFETLPELLLTVMRRHHVGVMIARGDLAVEVGFDRLSEVQEEILWACEVAHIPVIWATQVLDTLARTVSPSRAEVTDAAMSERAECVMLNKGPDIGEALGALDSILTDTGPPRQEAQPAPATARLGSCRVVAVTTMPRMSGAALRQ
jgi:pyruvate kinase